MRVSKGLTYYMHAMEKERERESMKGMSKAATYFLYLEMRLFSILVVYM